MNRPLFPNSSSLHLRAIWVELNIPTLWLAFQWVGDYYRQNERAVAKQITL